MTSEVPSAVSASQKNRKRLLLLFLVGALAIAVVWLWQSDAVERQRGGRRRRGSSSSLALGRRQRDDGSNSVLRDAPRETVSEWPEMAERQSTIRRKWELEGADENTLQEEEGNGSSRRRESQHSFSAAKRYYDEVFDPSYAPLSTSSCRKQKEGAPSFDTPSSFFCRAESGIAGPRASPSSPFGVTSSSLSASFASTSNPFLFEIKDYLETVATVTFECDNKRRASVSFTDFTLIDQNAGYGLREDPPREVFELSSERDVAKIGGSATFLPSKKATKYAFPWSTGFVEVRCGTKRVLRTRIPPKEFNEAVVRAENAAVAKLSSKSNREQLEFSKEGDYSRKSDGNDARSDLLVIMLDSVSRSTFFRAMPKTVGLLKALRSPLSSNDRENGRQPALSATHQSFLLNALSTIHREGTSPNALPLFAGRHWDADRYGSARSKTKVWAMEYDDGRAPKSLLYPPFLWDELKESGYVTAYGNIYGGFMGCRFWNNTFDVLLPSIAAYNTPPKYTDVLYKPDVSKGEGACVAGRFVSDFLLHYVEELFAERPAPSRARRFLYLPFYEGHRGEAASIGQVDEALAATLQRVLEKDTEERISVLLLGDHGFKGDERKHPFGAFILPKRRLSESSSGGLIGSALEENQLRLVSHFDLYLTLRHITGLPRSPEPKRKWGLDVPSSAVSLLEAVVPAERSCEKAGVHLGSCLCEKTTRVRPDRLGKTAEINGATAVAVAVVQKVDEAMRRVGAVPIRCEPLSFSLVRDVEKIEGGIEARTAEAVSSTYPIWFVHFDVENYNSRFELAFRSSVCPTDQDRSWKRPAQPDGHHQYTTVEGTEERVVDKEEKEEEKINDRGSVIPEHVRLGDENVECFAIISLRQTTQYSRFESCTDSRVEPDFCFCCA